MPAEQHNHSLSPPDSAPPFLGIVGAGQMGSGIASLCLQRGVDVTLMDRDACAASRGCNEIFSSLNRNHTQGETRHLLRRLHIPLEKDDLPVQNCDLVIETIEENVEAKLGVLHRLSRRIREGAILATNTSSIPIATLEQSVAHPARFVGLHFCHPVADRRLVEVIPGHKTNESTKAMIDDFARSLNRVPLLVQDRPGFVVNRLLFPYFVRVLDLILEGCDPRGIDDAMEEFGMRIGPVALMDEIGLQTVSKAGCQLARVQPSHVSPSPLLIALLKAGQTGKRSGAGFYLYPEETVNPRVEAVVRRWGQPHGDRRVSPENVLRPMADEARTMVENRIVLRPRDIDVASTEGLGFPVECGGLWTWAKRSGITDR